MTQTAPTTAPATDCPVAADLRLTWALADTIADDTAPVALEDLDRHVAHCLACAVRRDAR